MCFAHKRGYAYADAADADDDRGSRSGYGKRSDLSITQACRQLQ